MIRAILFDIDGTLVDSNDLHATAWREAFLHFGVDVPIERVRSQIGKGGDNLIPALLPDDMVERCQKEIEDFRSELFQRNYLPRAVPFPGVRELLERLYRDDKKVVLASSAKGAELKFHLQLIGARDLVTGTTSKDDVEHSKPCPDIFEAALAKVAPIEAKETAVVGDSPWDMKAAGKIGLICIGLRCGGFDESLLREAGAAEIYDDPADLLGSYEGSLLAR